MGVRTVVAVGVAAAAVAVSSAGSVRASTAAEDGAAATATQLLFDDFSYSRPAELRAHGWIVRTERGWPGVAGASWSAGNVSFVRDVAQRGNRLLALTSSTDGTRGGTSQTQVCHARKYLEGTYATRLRFHDAPSRGLDVDQVVETFYAISPLERPLDPSYSELDWEYLPNGGWGRAQPTLYATTWETARLDPWIADNTFTATTRSLGGWHTLVVQVGSGEVDYFLDGRRLARHGGRYYPEVPMSIDYNLWFVEGGIRAGGDLRRWVEEVDWVFHRAHAVLTPAQVAASVAALRRARVAFRDTVPPAAPPLASPCNL